MSNTVIGRNDLGLTISTFDDNGVVDPNTGVVATSVSITAVTELPGSTNVQEAIQALASGGGGGGSVSTADLISTAAGKGASMVGIQDVGTFYTGVTVEAMGQEIGTSLALKAVSSVLANTTLGTGASLIGIHDTGGIITATTVEGALAELKTIIDGLGSTYLTKANPTFTGQLLSTDRGSAAAVAIGGNFTGGNYGFFFDAGNFIGVARAGADIAHIDFQNITVIGSGAALTLGSDTALQRDAGTNIAVLANPLGLQVANGLSSWGHTLPPSQPVAGPATAGGTWTAAEQTMLQIVYDALRGNGTIS
jgi:hypothetical protein